MVTSGLVTETATADSLNAKSARVNQKLFDLVDISATVVFSIEGAAAAAFAGFDVLGVLVVGFAVGLGGGVIRDLLLGDLPPAAFRSPSRMISALVAALATFLAILAIPELSTESLVYLDAVGLALFAVTGAQKASEHGCNLLVVTIMGAITATGGGVIRDVLLNRDPYVLTASVYGTAALAGAFATGLLMNRTSKPVLAMWIGFTVTFALRVLAIHFGWELPHIAPAIS